MYKINLLPSELQRDLSIDVRKLVKRAAVSLVAVILLAGYGSFLYSSYSTRKEIAKTEKYLNELNVTVKKVEEIKKQRETSEQSAQKLKELLNNRLAWSSVLEDLNHNLPVDVWLERIDLSHIDLQASTGASGQPKGQADAQAPQSQSQPAPAQPNPAQAGTGAVPEGKPPSGQSGTPAPSSPPVPNTLTIEGYSRTVPSIGVFVNNLSRMPYFTRVTLNEFAEDEKMGAIKFKVTAAIKEGGR